ncbi:hypothetical protein BH11PLA1_BH11PLA1_10570 [soil metagenome]
MLPPSRGAVAIVDGVEVEAGGVWGELAEAAGGIVLRERILDERLAREAARAKIEIDEKAISAERGVLREAVAGAARLDEDGAERMLGTLRRARGLGEVRFAALLKRNATLRALVRGSVSVPGELVEKEMRLQTGERRRALILTTDTAGEAAAARREIVARAGELSGGGSAAPGVAALTVAFAEAARAKSTDASGAAGGVLPPLSVEDEVWPRALREAAGGMKAGELSGAIDVGMSGVRGERGGQTSGVAIVLLQEIVPGAAGANAAALRPALEARVRARLERAAMDDLTARLMAGGGVTVLDRSMAWSFGALRGE